MIHELFRKFATLTLRYTGSAWTFMVVTLIVFVWILTGVYFHYSQSWQLIFTFVTTLITFLLLFLIQYKQNRDTAAIHLKLDELLLATKNARNKLIDAENLPDPELEKHKKQLIKSAKKS